ncbi:DNA-binding response regulator, NarL/FixJ family, contains REC and HTH domains [Nannocystis exedens]|uniref:DNA-binding response regulator, NarL/FixJ family, contains REC and HTH domains n=1 Tax=Nannocystis exedens TaxID=54 RepID=A0A1I2J5E2_9BACT|nr:response regulator transcription factor [Nannocystis exedens]PCC67169.1 DNA-binding response regulator [Nannocystis exedens]SFF47931.1 DNA-binding response regulator, NarL/FixJ family, contains REC and HTH domains [Nannocystis exedens]
MQPRVILVDDQVMVLECLSVLLGAEFEVVGAFTDGATALAAARELQPDVVALELELPSLGGLDLVRALQASSSSRSVVVTRHADPQRAHSALAAGARGYVLKDASPEELVAGVHTVAAGGCHVSPAIEALLKSTSETAPRRRGGNLLTARQREILVRVAAGMAGKEIAGDLGIALKTVEFHKARISQQLGLRTRAAMTRYALEHGLAPLRKRD